VIEVRPFEASHLVGFQVQQHQRWEFAIQPEAPAAAFGEAWSGFADGAAICCAGLVPLWPGRAYAWALLSEGAASHLLELTRIARFVLETSGHGRIEAYVDAEFKQAQRWARMLGFVNETPTPMRKYLPEARDAFLYARVK
jgi:hypothetical protein